MKLAAFGLAALLAFPLFAQASDVEQRVFDAALNHVRAEVRAVNYAEKAKLPDEAIAVAQRTIGGAPEGYREFTNDNFGSVIAGELLGSYGSSGPEARLIDRPAVDGFAVLPLQQFERGAYDYDWERLNAKYPDVRYVMRVSWPIVDSLGAYAVVRYEMIGRNGPEHAAMTKFEKQNDGRWKGILQQVGNIWE